MADRRLIEDWMPGAESGEESIRERECGVDTYAGGDM